ncbi:MAG: 4Fe-4S dicluster domain-containing protein [Actinobacteria bacterium]|nr:4Fe-4S dicluster domain-containing protein [Actinomycetota bacterium]
MVLGAAARFKSIDADLKKEIDRLSGQKVDMCYLCGKCTAGCPVAPYQDIPPHIVLRLAQWGSSKVLESKMIWNCVACATCYTRCPNDVDVAKVCEAITQIAKREGIVADPAASALREKFVESVKSNGRVHELPLAMAMKVATKDYLGDLDVGIPMFFQGKFPLFGHQIKDLNNFQKLFNGKKAKKEGDK